MNLGWNVSALLEALVLSGKGMLGIFVVTAVIILTVMLLAALSKGKKDRANSD